LFTNIATVRRHATELMRRKISELPDTNKDDRVMLSQKSTGNCRTSSVQMVLTAHMPNSSQQHQWNFCPKAPGECEGYQASLLVLYPLLEKD